MHTEPSQTRETTPPAPAGPETGHRADVRRRPALLGASLAVTAASVLLLTGCAEAIRDAGEAGSTGGSDGRGGSSESAAPTASTEEATASDIQIFEDFACPHCATFHQQNGGLIHGLVSGGEVDAEYRIVDFLGQGDPESWSTRAGNAYYCMEDSLGAGGSTGAGDADDKLHAYQTWLFEQAPAQPEDAVLVSRADELAGDAGSIEQCVAEDGGTAQVTAAMSDFADFGLRGVPSVYSLADGVLYNAGEHGDLRTWLTDRSVL